MITLKPIPPYNFPLLLNILSRFAHPTLNIAQDNAYWRVIPDERGLALVRVTARGKLDEPILDVDIAATRGDVNQDTILGKLAHMMPFNVDRYPFYQFAQQDERLWNVVRPLVGLPELRTSSLFEALMQTIIEQQIAWVTAQRAQRWLVEWTGNAIAHNGVVHYSFPSAHQIAAAELGDLTPLKITFKRMSLMLDISRRVVAGEIELEALSTYTPQVAYQYLTNIKGIGHWTASVALERAYGYDHWITDNDVALQRAVNRYFYDGQGRVTPEQLMDTFRPYGAYAGLAARYTLYRWVLDMYPLRV